MPKQWAWLCKNLEGGPIYGLGDCGEATRVREVSSENPQREEAQPQENNMVAAAFSK